MTPFPNKSVGPSPSPGSLEHAHLLVTEAGGLVAMESPEAVMEEIEFRATHVSSLLEKMFEETGKHDWWEPDEGEGTR